MTGDAVPPAAPATGSPRVVAARVPDHGLLEEAFLQAVRQGAGLLPASLPALVIIKPNLCDIVSWEWGVTTDPRWIAVLARAVRAVRPGVRVCMVESDAISAYRSYRSCDETFERLGYVDHAAEAGVDLVNLSKTEAIDLAVPGIPMPLRVPQLFLEEFFFISIANLKVHPYERMTGVLKNSLGLLPGADISALHPYLSRTIAALHLLCPPDLAIIDGRIGLEGKGPIIGDPVRMDCLIAGNDALAVDETAARVMGIEPRDVPHLVDTARALGRPFGRHETQGSLAPRRFAFDPDGAHRTILAKFAGRRFHDGLQAASNRWIDRVMRARRHPIAFGRSLLRRALGGGG